MGEIHFFEEDVSYTLSQKDTITVWITNVIKSEGFGLGSINYVFCSDDYLHQINLQYLDHDTYTDIITFDQSEADAEVSGDIFISIDRVFENAKKIGTPELDELKRVLVHGVLHLMGFSDNTDEEKHIMRKKEEACLSLQPNTGT